MLFFLCRDLDAYSRWSTSLSSQDKFVETFWRNFTNQKKDVCMSLAAAGAGAGAGAGTGTGTGADTIHTADTTMKPWIRFARVNIGLPSVTYTESG